VARTPTTVHRLKVTLRRVKPPVWRRLDVKSTIKLSELSDVLEAAMGWYGGHLHAFEASGVRYEHPDELDMDVDRNFGPETVDEHKVRLRDVLPSVTSKLRWEYDFGDGWEHDVVVEAIEPARTGVRYPICLEGKRACPPEDCGGPSGYAELLAAVSDPSHEQRGELLEWLPPDFDPEAFAVDEATKAMQSPRPLQDWD
jgi:hypothetical protein